jgi:hypothetical protein
MSLPKYVKKRFPNQHLYVRVYTKLIIIMESKDRLCGLVVRVLGYRSGGPGSIPGTARFSEKKKKKIKQ